MSNIVGGVIGILLIAALCWLYRNPERMIPASIGGNTDRLLTFVRFFAIIMAFVTVCAIVSFMVTFFVSSEAAPLIVLPLAGVLTYVLFRRCSAVHVQHK